MGGHADFKLSFHILYSHQKFTKMAYIMNTLYIECLFEQLAKTAKTASFSV